MKNILNRLLGHQDLSMDEAKDVMVRIMSGEFNDTQIAGFLVALRAKGETASEIAGFAQAMRDKMIKVPLAKDAIDLCGTGGDAKGTFNISTIASFVVAGAGVPVAKHGNRSITSSCGSADLLAALGVDIHLPPEKVAQAIEKIGLGSTFLVLSPIQQVRIASFLVSLMAHSQRPWPKCLKNSVPGKPCWCTAKMALTN
jgi:anthranilate phosphoribosyltransferase